PPRRHDQPRAGLVGRGAGQKADRRWADTVTGMSGVMVSYVHPGWVQHTFMQSLLLTLEHDRRAATPVIRGVMPVRYRPAGIAHVRNEAVRTFLAGDAGWLWSVDTDMGFRADTLHALLAAADRGERPVVGALCYGLVEEEPDDMGGMTTRVFPTLHGWSDEMKAFTEWEGPVPQIGRASWRATG